MANIYWMQGKVEEAFSAYDCAWTENKREDYPYTVSSQRKGYLPFKRPRPSMGYVLMTAHDYFNFLFSNGKVEAALDMALELWDESEFEDDSLNADAARYAMIARLILNGLIKPDNIAINDFLELTVDNFRRAGFVYRLPYGLFLRAEYYRKNCEFDAAEIDLAEIFECSSATGMRCHLVDYHLEVVRLLLDKANYLKVLPNKPDALRHLDLASELITKTGYRLREAELNKLRDQVCGN